MKIESKKFFFSTLQLTCNIRQFRKFHFKTLKKYQNFAFFAESFKFELYKNLKRSEARNLFFILSVNLFVLDLCNVKSSFTRFCCLTLHWVLCYMTLHYRLNGSPVHLHIKMTRSKCVYL